MAAPQYAPNTQLFMRNVSYSCNQDEVHQAIARVLHDPRFGFSKLSVGLINFSVQLFRDKRGSRIHGGNGTLTLPSKLIYDKFLNDFGEMGRQLPISLLGKPIVFAPSNRRPPQAEVKRLNDTPYINPAVIREEERKNEALSARKIPLECIQCGWDCRDSVFSNEWQLSLKDSHRIFITVEGERREIWIQISPLNQDTSGAPLQLAYVMAISIPQIQFLTVDPQECAVHFSLFAPPSFISGQNTSSFSYLLAMFNGALPPRERYSHLPFKDDTGMTSHETIASYLSKSIRCVCSSDRELQDFQELCRTANITYHRTSYPVVHRHLFSTPSLQRLMTWLKELPYQVAFQVELLVRGQCVDFQEILSLKTRINEMTRRYGVQYTIGVLHQFGAQVADLWFDGREEETSFIGCFEKAEKEYGKQKQAKQRSSTQVKDGNFDCLHVSVTPTTILLEGPFPERTNRVLRKYEANQDSFLRVSFVDDNQLKFQFDRDINGRKFIKERVGSILKEGLIAGGRHFKFLAYSQSALKDHTVWFVSPFDHQTETGPIRVTSESIINELGTFKDIRCPARYAARLSQAFTATDASISLEFEEIFYKPDIETRDKKWCHTDGNGCFSPSVGEEIHEVLQSRRRRNRRVKEPPAAIQVRLGGSKGVLHRDYRLTGRTVILRPSMVKFDAPDSDVEIARVFDKPGVYYLNRPLIMLLEHLGIPYEIIKKFQDRAVREAQEAAQSLSRAAHLLESHGLGASFRLPSVLSHFNKIGVSDVEDCFYDRVMEFATNHVLRELKQKARIPIPGAYTLVGIADIHGFLQEGEIFACVQHAGSNKKIYLEGDIVISRSPTIHPGDVRIARAIGRPPLGSCFDKEPLANTVVFATKGDRPLPSCLGGGDLDGDEYNLIPLNDPNLADFRPKNTHPPGEYEPAKRHILDRESTMDDVADFVVDYINSDVLGIIAINWLVIADQSEAGVFDPDCLRLSQLHSDAVDYPKSGVPVPVTDIPRLKHKIKPDWNAPETVNVDPSKGKYYESKRFIGRLFRDIDLPALNVQPRLLRQQRRRIGEAVDEVDDIDEIDNLLATADLNDPIYDAVMGYISEEDYINPWNIPRGDEIQQNMGGIYSAYVTELHHICKVHALSRSQGSMLTEEEAVAGTIVARTSQQRKRKDMMSKLREQTDILVRRTRDEIMGEEDAPLKQSLERGCLAFELGLKKKTSFGAKSFSWVALGVIFETVRDIDEERRFMRGRARSQ